MGIKIKSDGTIPGTSITTNNGVPITTVTKFMVVMDANKPAGHQTKAIIELALPDLEMELPPENVDWQPSSLKTCEICHKEIAPRMELSNDGRPKAIYSCCGVTKDYVMDFNWDKQPTPEDVKVAIEEALKDGGE
jgi:hypothetical protein